MPAVKTKKKKPRKTTANAIKLVVGLGNPGSRYAQTYHNLGYLALDYFLRHLAPPAIQWVEDKKLHGEYAFVDHLLFLKPQTFMNDSGKAVRHMMHKYHLRPEALLVLHDDSDLTLGQCKLSWNRGAAGHRGVQSIIDQLKTKSFWRLRIGIRPVREKIRGKAEKLVLRKIEANEKTILLSVFQEGLQIIEKLTLNEKEP